MTFFLISGISGIPLCILRILVLETLAGLVCDLCGWLLQQYMRGAVYFPEVVKIVIFRVGGEYL